MKKLVLSTLIAVSALGFYSCDPTDDPTPNPSGITELSGDITTNTTLSASKKYKLKGHVYVKDGATLTIEPGTVIFGEKSSKSTLIITRTGKIMAEGTASNPIVFTSGEVVGAKDAGDWGGIVVLGKAPVNTNSATEGKIEGGLVPTNAANEKDYIYYGGTDASHSSGTLKYVRIEFAGIALTPDNELNSLTMGGVGSGTTISHIQVYKGGDDAYEWFGGTVNCDHLVATYSLDDDFDSDNGYNGKVQFGLIQRHKNIADVSGSNGFESDNDANGTTTNPQTKATFSNITVVGPYQGTTFSGINANYQNGAQIRRNSSISIHNSIFMGYPVGLYIDNTKGTATSGNIAAGTLKYRNNILAGCKDNLKTSSPYTIEDLTAFFTAGNNQTFASTADIKLVDPYKFSASVSGTTGRPDFRLGTGSPALSGASFTGMSGFTNTTYIGAFNESNDWTAGWTEWDADNKTY